MVPIRLHYTDICLLPFRITPSITLWHKARLGNQLSGGSFNSTGCSSYIMSLHYAPTSCMYIPEVKLEVAVKQLQLNCMHVPTACSCIVSQAIRIFPRAHARRKGGGGREGKHFSFPSPPPFPRACARGKIRLACETSSCMHVYTYSTYIYMYLMSNSR